MIFPFRKKIWLATGLLAVTIAGYGQVQSAAYRLMLKKMLSHSVPEMQVQEAAKGAPDILFFDAREEKEFTVSHLAGALCVGYDSFDIKKIPASIDKRQRIVVYCSVGYRSEKVTEQLRAAGYSDVSNLYGGIFEWVNQRHPVFNDQGETSEVHAYSRTWGVWLRRGKKVY